MSYKNDMKEAAQIGTIFGMGIFSFLIFCLLVGAGFTFIAFYSYQYWAPKYEQVRFDTFKQSQAYNDGQIRDLQDLKIEYIKANDEQKVALKAIIRHRFSVYDVDRLPVDLRSFYQEIK